MLSTVTFILGVKLTHSGAVATFSADFKAHLSAGNCKVVNGSCFLVASTGVWQQDRAYVNIADSDSLTTLLARGQDPQLAETITREAKAAAAASQGKFSVAPAGFQLYMEICPGAPVKSRGAGKAEVVKKDPNAPKRPGNSYMIFSN